LAVPAFYGAYYPAVIRCPNWQWDANGPAEREAAEAQRRAIAQSQEAAEAQRRAIAQSQEAERQAAQARVATALAKLEAEREAAKARQLDAAQTDAENSPDNACREPDVASRIIKAFNKMDWPIPREAIDIEHLVTIDRGGGRSFSCHGVWVLNNGQNIEGTLSLKLNVAGDPIAIWKQEGVAASGTFRLATVLSQEHHTDAGSRTDIAAPVITHICISRRRH
jgi:hypothetical protein